MRYALQHGVRYSLIGSGVFQTQDPQLIPRRAYGLNALIVLPHELKLKIVNLLIAHCISLDLAKELRRLKNIALNSKQVFLTQ